MKKPLLFALTAIMVCGTLTAQINERPAHRTCGTENLSADYEIWLQEKIQEYKEAKASGKLANIVYTIPVVVHVIHNGTNVGIAQNISDAQILSQIEVLNEDFRRLNTDASNTPPAFVPVAADAEINFCLAQTGPDGLPTTGINRVNRNTMGWTAPPYTMTYVNGTIKPATIWNPNQYLNLWVVPDYNSSGFPLLGHATFPASSTLPGLNAPYGTLTSDGVVIWYKAFGRVGILDPSYDEGRTATHEIGHWLGLRHIWGDSQCGTDYCADTPTQKEENYFCPSYPKLSTAPCVNSPNGDMFMNYMDYCDDPCMNTFTLDQKTRMHTVMLNSPFRVALAQSTTCQAPTSIDERDGVKLNIYPNPSNGMLTVTLSGRSFGSEVEFNVMNAAGASLLKDVQQISVSGEYTLDLQSLASGIYLLDIKTGDVKRTEKITIKK